MKILISDYAEAMMPTHDLEIETLKKGLGNDIEVEIYEYTDEKRKEFIEKIKDVDALLTAFIKLDKEILESADKLKVISLNSTGFDKVDFEVANRKNIVVCPVGEYCTQDVSEAAIAFVFALNKGLKFYDSRIYKNKEWNYSAFPEVKRLENSVIGIFGYGKIGSCTARKLSKIVKKIYVYDERPIEKERLMENVEAKDKDYILNNSDIIINHMSLTETNRDFFNKETFDKMLNNPIFINMSRGDHVVEKDLVEALDNNVVRACGLDVLKEENPELEGNPLLNRDNVIITPHSAFYSKDSINNLMRISSNNIVYSILGDYDKVNKIVKKKS